MAQPRGRANKVQLIVNDQLLKSLTKCGKLHPQDGDLTISEIKRKYHITDGVTEWPPVTASVLNTAENGARDILVDWYFNKRALDVVYQKLDGHNQIYEEYLLPDTEIQSSTLGSDYDASNVVPDELEFIMSFYEPIIIE